MPSLKIDDPAFPGDSVTLAYVGDPNDPGDLLALGAEEDGVRADTLLDLDGAQRLCDFVNQYVLGHPVYVILYHELHSQQVMPASRRQFASREEAQEYAKSIAHLDIFIVAVPPARKEPNHDL